MCFYSQSFILFISNLNQFTSMHFFEFAFLIRRSPLKEPEVLLELALVILFNFYLTPQEISITKVYVLMIGYLILTNWVFSSIHEWRT